MTSLDEALRDFAQSAAKLKRDEKSVAQPFLLHLAARARLRLAGICRGCILDILMRRERQTRGPGEAAGYVSRGGELFYGAGVGPGRYQGGVGVARGFKVAFSVLRMLIQPSRKPAACDPQATHKPPSSQDNATRLGGEPCCFSGASPVSQLASVARAAGLKGFWACGRLGTVAWSVTGLESIYAII